MNKLNSVLLRASTFVVIVLLCLSTDNTVLANNSDMNTENNTLEYLIGNENSGVIHASQGKTMKRELTILWTNADAITSEKMVFMYSINSFKYDWWDEITIVIWGATAKLAAENDVIKAKIKEAQNAGVKISACKSCAEQLGVKEELEKQGIEIRYWGKGLSDIIQNEKNLLTI